VRRLNPGFNERGAKLGGGRARSPVREHDAEVVVGGGPGITSAGIRRAAISSLLASVPEALRSSAGGRTAIAFR
jgi:hypothetical protein